MRLAVPSKFGEEAIVSHGLFVEANSGEDAASLGGLVDRVHVAHAPWVHPGTDVRMNIASVRKNVREEALNIIESHIEKAHASFPNLQVVVSHAAPHYFPDPPVRPKDAAERPVLRPEFADWGRLLESARRLARRCARLGLVLAVENNWAYWEGIPPEADVAELGPGDFLEYFCSSPQEWRGLAEEVNDPALRLCLDPSHAVPYCHRKEDIEGRKETLLDYLARPGLIAHFHWNGSEIRSPRGRNDLHLAVGTGDLGEEFHAAVKARAQELPQPSTLEHFHGLPALEAELSSIQSLQARPLP